MAPSSVKHKKVVSTPDNGASGQVQPSDWNDGHEIDFSPLLAKLDGLAATALRVPYINNSGDGALAPLGAVGLMVLALSNADDIVNALSLVGANSPHLTGVPTAPTAAAGTNTTQLATTAFVAAAITALINSAPGALDTLKELSDALGADANFSTTVTNALAAKAPIASPTFTGTPAAPTVAGTSDSTTKIATTAFVQAVAATLTPLPAASQAQLEAGSSNTVATTPGRQHNHPSAAKAWALWNGAGTAISLSYNVSSLTDNGAGDHTINFATAFSSADHSDSLHYGWTSNSGTIGRTYSKTASQTRFLFYNTGNGNNNDPDFCSMQAFGDQ